MEYKITEFGGVFLGGDDTIAKNWTVGRTVFFSLKDYPFLVEYSL